MITHIIINKKLDDACFEAHIDEQIEHPLAEVTLNQYFSPTRTASDAQTRLQARSHGLEGLVVTGETRHDSSLLTRTAFALEQDVEPRLTLLLQGITLIGLILRLGICVIVVGNRHVKRLA